MKDARSLLDNLLGGQGALGRAAGVLQGQSAMTKGALAGGLIAVLMGGKSTRKLAKSALKVGGAALVGGLAYKAWQDWQAGKAPAADTGPVALPSPSDRFLPADPVAADDLSARLVRAMVAAAKADGHVTNMERQRIAAQLAELGLTQDARSMIEAELAKPLDVGAVAALARTPEEAAEVYAASLLVVDPEAPAERGYLALLAARLGIDPALVDHLHARAASVA